MTDATTNHDAMRDVVRSITVGSRVAEEEIESLSRYFVKTESWRQVRQGEVDVVFAPKGGGKSAIFAMLLSSEDDFFDDKTLLITADNPQGDPAFSAVDTDTTEAEFRDLWKLYFIVLLAQTFSDYGFNSGPAKQLNKTLDDAGLLPNAVKRRRSLVMTLINYIRRISRSGVQSVEAGVSVGAAGASVTPKVVFRETTDAERAAGVANINDLMDLAQEALEYSEYSVWILLDRLDAAFLESPEFERNALRGLFRAYRDMDVMSNVSLRIFLRTDIWDNIIEGGFREASHITRTLEIKWAAEDLMQLVIQRLAQSPKLIDWYKIPPDGLVSSAQRTKFFYEVFPRQVDSGAKKPDTFDWCLTRTADGKGTNAPRELIHLFGEVRAKQLKLLELGTANLIRETIFDSRAFKDALPAVSASRIQQTLLAENPTLKPYVEALRGGKTRHNVASLAQVWDIPDADAARIAEQLVAAGFFEPRQSDFWIPFLYRPGLDLVQGSAAGVSAVDSE